MVDDSIDSWEAFTGDGDVWLQFLPMDNFARMQIDPIEDLHNECVNRALP